MIQAEQRPESGADNGVTPDIALKDILSTARVTAGLRASSKKKLLERMTDLLLEGTSGLNENIVLQILIERERLGSTAIGKRVALPHGRVPELDHAVGAFATLEPPMDFDAADGEPVKMVFALLVPAEATEAHLRILARLAALFSNDAVRESLADTMDASELYHRLVDGDASTTPG